jgi:hypothetical protein
MEGQVRRRIQEQKEQKGAFQSRYNKEITEKLEKLRRGEL